jgi:cysteine desulfurase
MIYADYNGSAPPCLEVCEYLQKRLAPGAPFANPNAIHKLGKKIFLGMENARAVCAKNLGAKPFQLTLTSGATEAISIVMHSLIEQATSLQKKTIICSSIEHSAVHRSVQYYEEKYGFRVLWLPTLPSGVVDINMLETWLIAHHKDLAFVTVMAANNETGVIQPYREISEFCQRYNVPYFSDTTQIIAKDDFHFIDSGMDYAVLSSHKVGALIGSGLILSKNPENLRELIIGGGQEKYKRGGTQNYIGMETMAVALKAFQEKYKERLKDLKEERIQFEAQIKKMFPQVVILGEEAERLATTTYLSYPGIHGQAVQIELECQDIFVTTSSACSDNLPVTSKVLKSMNINDSIGRGVVRISVGACAPFGIYQHITEGLVKAYKKLIPINCPEQSQF